MFYQSHWHRHALLYEGSRWTKFKTLIHPEETNLLFLFSWNCLYRWKPASLRNLRILKILKIIKNIKTLKTLEAVEMSKDLRPSKRPRKSPQGTTQGQEAVPVATPGLEARISSAKGKHRADRDDEVSLGFTEDEEMQMEIGEGPITSGDFGEG